MDALTLNKLDKQFVLEQCDGKFSKGLSFLLTLFKIIQNVDVAFLFESLTLRQSRDEWNFDDVIITFNSGLFTRTFFCRDEL